jgi:phage tail sheath protein FI
MPEYLAPGVFVEEVSFRSKSIEGVSTTTTGFIGPTRYGPIDLDNEIVTSLLDYERTYGSRLKLDFAGAERHNFSWQAVRAFFEEGGKRLYVSRVFRRRDDVPYAGLDDGCTTAPYDDGHARARLAAGSGASFSALGLSVWARYPGKAGNGRVRLTLRAGQNVLSIQSTTAAVAGLLPRDVVLITRKPTAWAAATGPFYLCERDQSGAWSFVEQDDPDAARFPLADVTAADVTGGTTIRAVTVAVTHLPADEFLMPQSWEGLALDPAHVRDGAPDSLGARFELDGQRPSRNRDIPIVIDAGAPDGLTLLETFLEASVQGPYSGPTPLEAALRDEQSTAERRTLALELQGGNDGRSPTATEYEGREIPDTTRKTGLKQFEDLEDVSIVAAPGSTYSGTPGELSTDADQITRLLIGHCERMRYRVAVLDSANGMTISQVRQMKGTLDSKHAALYYPWVLVTDPLTRQLVALPPSGFVAGIYARNDVNRAVYKAPANEVVTLAQGFETLLNKAQQEVLNPEGINAFRYFEGRGFRLWGARTISSDPEWKYVNVRRYFAYLERSIDKGTQWAVFEPNGEALWANVRRTIEDFLLNEWQTGALLGDKPERSFFVRCDRSTMTQNDLDNGRLVCLIGVAPLKPAEFVIFRIGQWTADRK